MESRKKTVVITGASSGNGQATAEAFAREGLNILIATRNAAALQFVTRTCLMRSAAVESLQSLYPLTARDA
jgi:NAD(P)-dependent dehydrogenase (short-subunit alcohol dehydrogenase family)